MPDSFDELMSLLQSVSNLVKGDDKRFISILLDMANINAESIKEGNIVYFFLLFIVCSIQFTTKAHMTCVFCPIYFILVVYFIFVVISICWIKYAIEASILLLLEHSLNKHDPNHNKLTVVLIIDWQCVKLRPYNFHILIKKKDFCLKEIIMVVYPSLCSVPGG